MMSVSHRNVLRVNDEERLRTSFLQAAYSSVRNCSDPDHNHAQALSGWSASGTGAPRELMLGRTNSAHDPSTLLQRARRNPMRDLSTNKRSTRNRPQTVKSQVPPEGETDALPAIPLASPSSTGYYRARIAFNADIMSVAGLTSVHLGKSSKAVFHRRGHIEKLKVSGKTSTYLDFVPSFYAESRLISTVVNCVLARIQIRGLPRRVQTSFSTKAYLTRLYGAALREVQQAVKDFERQQNPELLLAVALLQIFELLDEASYETWSNHTRGLMRLIRLRGPHNFKSDLEIELLRSQSVNFAFEATATGEVHPLEGQEWKSHLRNQIPSAELDMTLAQVQVVRVVRLTRDYLMRHRHDHKAMATVVDECNKLTEMGEALVATGPFDTVQWTLGIARNRSLVALQPLSPLSIALEKSSQDMASQIMQLPNPGHRIYLAQGTYRSRYVWADAIAGSTDFLDQKQCIKLQIFDQWRTAICGPRIAKVDLLDMNIR